MRVERGRRYELRHNTNATALVCAAGLLFPACCRSFPAVSRWFPFPAPSRYGLCTVAYSGVSARSIGWLSVRLSRMGATQLHYHCLRFNSSTGSRTTLCGPPRILAGSIRFIGYFNPGATSTRFRAAHSTSRSPAVFTPSNLRIPRVARKPSIGRDV